MFRGRDVCGNLGRGDFGIDQLISAYLGLFELICDSFVLIWAFSVAADLRPQAAKLTGG